jgi:hypothetical protein
LPFDEDLLLLPATPSAFDTANSEPAINPFLRRDDKLLFLFNFSSWRIWCSDLLRFRVASDQRESSLDEDDEDDEVRFDVKMEVLLLLFLTLHPCFALHFSSL